MAPFQRNLLLVEVQKMKFFQMAIALICVTSLLGCSSEQQLPDDSTPLSEVPSSSLVAFCDYADGETERVAHSLGILEEDEPMYPDGETVRRMGCPDGFDVTNTTYNKCVPSLIVFSETDCNATVGDWRECQTQRAEAMCTYGGTVFGDPLPACERLSELCPGS